MRPEKIHLEEPIFINGIEIGHSKEGLIYLIDHYEGILKNSNEKQLDSKARQHLKEWLIPNLQYHLQLYKTQNENFKQNST